MNKNSASNSGAPKFLIEAQRVINAGRLLDAVEILKGGLAENEFTAARSIGDIYCVAGDHEKALKWFSRACECTESIDVRLKICRILLNRKDHKQALDELAVRLNSINKIEDASAYIDEYLKFGLAGKVVDVLCDSVNERRIDREAFIHNVTKTFRKKRCFAKLEKWYRHLISAKPSIRAYLELCKLLRNTGRLSEALELQKLAIKQFPKVGDFWHDLGFLYISVGEVEQGKRVLEQMAEFMPDNIPFHDNLLFYMHNNDNASMEELFEAHKNHAAKFYPYMNPNKKFDLDRDPDRKLRIGYVSPDFKQHSVTFFFKPLLYASDKSRFEIFAYSNVSAGDRVTEYLKERFDHWRDISSMNNKDAAEQIENDRIDILVDLAGHTGNNRLGVFALKPAPIQVTYLGYPNTTGLTTIDYRLTDTYAEIENAQDYYTEKLYYLEDGFLCFEPLFDPGDVQPLPAKKNGYLTFGCFNNHKKVNENVIRVWSKILSCCPDSRLILKFNCSEDKVVREHFFSSFEKFGINRNRIEIYGHVEKSEHYKVYGKIDISLDPFPYNGTTTTFESLWTGVPVLTLAGQRHSSRVSYSIQKRLGLDEFCCENEEDYIAKGISLSDDIERLAEIRSGLRQRIAESPLSDSKRFARTVEKAYRQMWKEKLQTL